MKSEPFAALGRRIGAVALVIGLVAVSVTLLIAVRDAPPLVMLILLIAVGGLLSGLQRWRDRPDRDRR